MPGLLILAAIWVAIDLIDEYVRDTRSVVLLSIQTVTSLAFICLLVAVAAVNS